MSGKWRSMVNHLASPVVPPRALTSTEGTPLAGNDSVVRDEAKRGAHLEGRTLRSWIESSAVINLGNRVRSTCRVCSTTRS